MDGKPLSSGWTITSTTLAEFFVEVETIIAKLLVEQDVYVIFDVRGAANRYVQALPDDEDGGLWCETVADTFLGTADSGPSLNAAEIEKQLRDRWQPPTETYGGVGANNAPNWHRHIPPDTPGAPALASQLLVSTLIDVHGVRHPAQITVSIGPRSR